MEEHPEQRLLFEEEQRFPLWVTAIVLLPVFALGYPAILVWVRGGTDLGLARVLLAVLAILALVGAALTLMTRLVTELDSTHLSLRIYPQKWSLLPRRMTHKDIALGDISRWEVRTYNALLSTEYWGWHFWGLGVAKGGRYLYMMRPRSPISGRGVQLQLASGERVLVGTKHPEQLVDAITTSRSGSP